MQLSQALDIINACAPQRIDSLHYFLPEDLISQALAQTDAVKRQLPLESMVWLLIGLPYADSPGAVLRQLKNIYEMSEGRCCLNLGDFSVFHDLIS